MTTEQDDFDAQVAAKLAASGVSMTPGVAPVANADRTRMQHTITQRVTGAAGQPLPPWAQQAPALTVPPLNAYGPALTWYHHLSRAQTNDVDVSIYVRSGNLAPFRGKIAPEKKLSELDQDSATRLRTVTLILKSGGAPERRVTLDLAEIFALTEHLPEKKPETDE